MCGAPAGTAATSAGATARLPRPRHYLVNELEAIGYVERVPDPADGRAKLVRPTAKGRAGVEEARRAATEIERDIAELMGEQRLEELKALLTELHEKLWPPAA